MMYYSEESHLYGFYAAIETDKCPRENSLMCQQELQKEIGEEMLCKRSSRGI